MSVNGWIKVSDQLPAHHCAVLARPIGFSQGIGLVYLSRPAPGEKVGKWRCACCKIEGKDGLNTPEEWTWLSYPELESMRRNRRS